MSSWYGLRYPTPVTKGDEVPWTDFTVNPRLVSWLTASTALLQIGNHLHGSQRSRGGCLQEAALQQMSVEWHHKGDNMLQALSRKAIAKGTVYDQPMWGTHRAWWVSVFYSTVSFKTLRLTALIISHPNTRFLGLIFNIHKTNINNL